MKSFVMVPDEWLTSGLDGDSFHLLCLLAKYARGDGTCHLGTDEIARILKVPDRKIRRLLHTLEDGGWIRREYQDRSRRHLVGIVVPGAKRVGRGPAVAPSPIPGDPQQSDTSVRHSRTPVSVTVGHQCPSQTDKIVGHQCPSQTDKIVGHQCPSPLNTEERPITERPTERSISEEIRQKTQQQSGAAPPLPDPDLPPCPEFGPDSLCYEQPGKHAKDRQEIERIWRLAVKACGVRIATDVIEHHRWHEAEIWVAALREVARRKADGKPVRSWRLIETIAGDYEANGIPAEQPAVSVPAAPSRDDAIRIGRERLEELRKAREKWKQEEAEREREAAESDKRKAAESLRRMLEARPSLAHTLVPKENRINERA